MDCSNPSHFHQFDTFGILRSNNENYQENKRRVEKKMIKFRADSFKQSQATTGIIQIRAIAQNIS